VTIVDTGPGWAEGFAKALFDFVSEGKQKATGLGLTLAWSVARQHDGDVKLISSRAGETIFRFNCIAALTGIDEEPLISTKPRC